MLVYIHGFNSSAASRTFGLLRESFPDAHALEYPSGGHFAANLASLQRHIESLGRQRAAPPLVITGASLGGFYAAQLSARLSCPCALINPVIWPQQTLRPFVGQQKHFHSGEYWQFSLKACQSYADFPDPRQTPLPRLVVLGLNDELLDPAQSMAYWQGHALIHTSSDGHSLSALSQPLLDWLRAQQLPGNGKQKH